MSLDQAETGKLAELADIIDEADYVTAVRIVTDMDSTSASEHLILADDCAAIVAALRRPAPRPSDAGVREAIARIIDQDTFEAFDLADDPTSDTNEITRRWIRKHHALQRDAALAKADAILALTAPVPTAAGEYDPAFVQSVLDADGKPPAASFDNAKDMLEWLNALPNSAADVRAKVVEATKPFVDAMKGVPQGYVDNRPLTHVPNDARTPGTMTIITYGHVRALLAALSPDTGTKAGGERQG